jgi:hypothetical protein
MRQMAVTRKVTTKRDVDTSRVAFLRRTPATVDDMIPIFE